MPTYQLRFTFPSSGRTHFVAELDAPDDAAALRNLQRRPRDPHVELWCDDRLVGRGAGEVD